VILLPRTASCSEVNYAMLQQLGAEIKQLDALDTLDTIVSKKQMQKVTDAYEKVAEDVTRTAGLEKKLSLCTGAKVMLKRNKDVEIGLVNGAVGTVVSFEENKHHNIQQVLVKFQCMDKPIPVLRESSTFEVLKGIFYTRRQFPLMLAFALTVHKAQGLSLRTAIVDAGAQCFGTGMIYVALSRVTTLNGLHLIDLDKGKIKCDEKAAAEYQRLRENCASLQNTTTSMHPTELLQPTADHTDFEMPLDSGNNNQTVTNNELQVHSIFQFCSIKTVGNDFRQSTCARLNLPFSRLRQRPVHNTESITIEQLIYQQTNTRTKVQIFPIAGDGNCLFRSLALAMTGNQKDHEIMRLYVTNRMLDHEIREHMENIYLASNHQESYDSYVRKMQQFGEWGTDQEIVAAANLFDCSIVCYSGEGARLQHFPPHFLHNVTCTDCKHSTIMLVNQSGRHYEYATVN